jgi:hypothetical protein
MVTDPSEPGEYGIHAEGSGNDKAAKPAVDPVTVAKSSPKGAGIKASGGNTAIVKPHEAFTVTKPSSSTGGLQASKRKDQKKMDEQEVMIDGVAYKLAPDTAKAVAKLQARADAADKARLDAEDTEKFSKRVSARVALERLAARHLGDERMDEKSDRQLKIDVLSKLGTEAGEKWSHDYLDARFDAAIEYASEHAGEKALGEIRAVSETAQRGDAADATRTDSKVAYAKYKNDLQNAWKKPVTDGVKKGSK